MSAIPAKIATTERRTAEEFPEATALIYMTNQEIWCRWGRHHVPSLAARECTVLQRLLRVALDGELGEDFPLENLLLAQDSRFRCSTRPYSTWLASSEKLTPDPTFSRKVVFHIEPPRQSRRVADDLQTLTGI